MAEVPVMVQCWPTAAGPVVVEVILEVTTILQARVLQIKDLLEEPEHPHINVVAVEALVNPDDGEAPLKVVLVIRKATVWFMILQQMMVELLNLILMVPKVVIVAEEVAAAILQWMLEVWVAMVAVLMEDKLMHMIMVIVEVVTPVAAVEVLLHLVGVPIPEALEAQVV